MEIYCASCTTIEFSLSNWGKTDADLWKLEEKASKISPYYRKTEAIISEETIKQIETHYPNLAKREL